MACVPGINYESGFTGADVDAALTLTGVNQAAINVIEAEQIVQDGKITTNATEIGTLVVDLAASDAKILASEIKAGAEKEKQVLNDTVMNHCDADLENMTKQNAAVMDLEQRKAVRDVVDEVMNDVMAQVGQSLDKDKMAQIIMKKVA